MASIIVHGGAYAIPDSIADEVKRGCEAAAQEGYKVLSAGKTALDAVEEAVRILEDDPLMDAGHGSVLNAAGEVEMDAIIVDGATLNFGSVAAVKNIAHPITLARMVMERTDHVMLVGNGANLFAKEMGFPEIPTEKLVTEQALKDFHKFKEYPAVVSDVFNKGHDTVGAVAIDLQGNIAAATSTGGVSLKRVGRVGDSPLIGGGAFADNEWGGVSCTGHGESIAKVLLAQRIVNGLNRHSNEQGGVIKEGLKYMLDKVGGRGGAILMKSDGESAAYYTTEKMAWASVDKTGSLKSGL